MTNEHKNKQVWRWAPIVVLAAGLALRLAFVAETKGLPHFRTPPPGLDVDLHWQAASYILAGERDGVFELMIPSAPLFPYLLALLRWLLGDSIALIRVVFACGSVVCGLFLLAVVARMVRYGPAVLGVALLWALNPTLIYFDTMLVKATVELLLLAAVLLLVIRSDARSPGGAYADTATAGVLLALLSLSQLSALLYGAAVALYLTLKHSDKRHGILLGLVLVVPIALAQFAFARRSPTSERLTFWPQSGVHIRIGMHAQANGQYSRLPEIPNYPYGHTLVARMVAERTTGRRLTPARADRHYTQAALRFARAEPGVAAAILLKKVRLFLSHHEPMGNDYLYHVRTLSDVLKLPALFALVLFLAIVGALAQRRARLEILLLVALVGCVLVGNLISFVNWRYRLHAIVPLLVLAGLGFRGVALMFRAWRIRRYRAGNATSSGGTWWFLLPLAPASLVLLVSLIPAPARDRANQMRVARENEARALRSEDLQARLRSLPEDRSSLQERLALLHMLMRFTEARRAVEKQLTTAAGTIPASSLTAENTLALQRWLVYLLWANEYGRVAEVLGRIAQQSPREFELLLKRMEVEEPLVYGIIREFIIPNVRQGSAGPR